MTDELYQRRGCSIAYERWTEEKRVNQNKVVVAGWIEFKNQSGKTLIKITYNLWKYFTPEIRDAIQEKMRENYG